MAVPKRTKMVGPTAKVESAEGAETVVATLAGIDTTPENDAVQLIAVIPIDPGLESVLQTVRIRRNGVEGTEVEKVELTTVASTEDVAVIQARDKPGEVANMSYVVTLAGTATKKTEADGVTLTAIY